MLKDIFYIGGVARSGTSWIGQIFNSIPDVRFRFQPMFSYEFRETIDEDSTTEEYQQFFKDLFECDSDFLTQRDKVEKGVYPAFEKKDENILAFKENRFQSFISPMMNKCPNLKFIGVIRNPNAVLYSWTQNNKEFPEDADIMEEWRFANCKNQANEDYFGYYKWKEVANLYLDLKQKYGDRVYLVHYDKFVEATIENVMKMFEHFNLPYTSQTKQFLQAANKRTDDNYYSVFKSGNNRDKWKEHLPSAITHAIEADLRKTRLEPFLY